MTIQEEVLTQIREMGKMRKVPQLLFCSSAYPSATFSLREQMMDYKKKNTTFAELDFIIQSPGGLADEAYKIIRTLRHTFTTVNVIVPFWAKSAATLMSLGGSTIIMDEFAEFGPLDAQLGKMRDDSPELERESALNDEHSLRRIEMRYKEMFESLFLQVYEHKKINISKGELSQQLFENLSKFYEPLLKQIDPYKLGDKRRKLDIGGQYATRILLQFHPGLEITAVRKLVDYLVDACPDHGYVIDYDLMSRFLPYVKKPEEAFGKDYADALSKLTTLFIKSMFVEEEIDKVEFVESLPDPASTSSAGSTATVDVNIPPVVEEVLDAPENGNAAQSPKNPPTNPGTSRQKRK